MSLSIKIEVTIPDEVLNAAAVRDAIIKSQQQNTGPDLRKLFERTVNEWRNRPDFLQHQEITQNRIAMEVYPAPGQRADQYALVTAGSPKHLIPLQPGFLRFRKGYTAATKPRIIASRAFTRFGDYWVARQVHHPGFKARAFDETIAEQYKSTFEKDMQDAINQGSKVP